MQHKPLTRAYTHTDSSLHLIHFMYFCVSLRTLPWAIKHISGQSFFRCLQIGCTGFFRAQTRLRVVVVCFFFFILRFLRFHANRFSLSCICTYLSLRPLRISRSVGLVRLRELINIKSLNEKFCGRAWTSPKRARRQTLKTIKNTRVPPPLAIATKNRAPRQATYEYYTSSQLLRKHAAQK